MTARSSAERVVGPGRLAAGLLVALALAAMAVVTALDVIGRYLLNAPLPGSYELVGLLLAITVFAALPLATLGREHVVVDVLDHLLPPRLVALQRAVTEAAAGAVLAVLAWQLWLRGERLALEHATTNLLAIPLAPVAFLMAAFTALAAAAMVILAGVSLRERSSVRTG
ncbi:TRAP transporter small permease [Elioraea tepida]|uniref:TRAP transporter small permease protein n=1 Tax=Elioraea tepida TaxID=2843330 RepID=A0A975U2Z6_9PROT|nr:TRAP transporter small permease [Elioraea tepida]QXM25017.1 TRAP transporter small permease [Elioraea tepida]